MGAQEQWRHKSSRDSWHNGTLGKQAWDRGDTVTAGNSDFGNKGTVGTHEQWEQRDSGNTGTAGVDGGQERREN